MEKFTSITSVAAPILDANIDTDIIFPARFLVVTDKDGLGGYGFYEKRFDAEGRARPEFVLNREPFTAARILVAGDNFGCGSSREHAPWALRDMGIRCIIATSFGEIFYSNCFKNGLLPIIAAPDDFTRIAAHAASGVPLTVDLAQGCIDLGDGASLGFDVPAWRKEALLNGWDEIEMILRRDGMKIAAFEAQQRTQMPWLHD